MGKLGKLSDESKLPLARKLGAFLASSAREHKPTRMGALLPEGGLIDS